MVGGVERVDRVVLDAAAGERVRVSADVRVCVWGGGVSPGVTGQGMIRDGGGAQTPQLCQSGQYNSNYELEHRTYSAQTTKENHAI